jgi:exonuclease III
MKPGEVRDVDYRRNGPNHKSNGEGIKIIQWNIERGYKLPEIISILKKYDADIICIQEIDLNCERTNHKGFDKFKELYLYLKFQDVGEEIAQALSMKYAFVNEFQEIHSELRDKNTQVKASFIPLFGHKKGGGYHGNGILTKYDCKTDIIDHEHQPFNWERDGHIMKEPRKGRSAFDHLINNDITQS